MCKRRTGLNNLAYMGVEAITPPQMFCLDRNPTPGDKTGFNVGTFWLNSDSFSLWILAGFIGGQADWRELALDVGPLQTLTGDVGGAVPPTLNNINVVGSGSVLVSGNPGASTLTISVSNLGAENFPTDAGTATAVGGVLNVLGGDNINTAGAGNTVTVNLNDYITWPVTNGALTEGAILLGGNRFMHAFGVTNTFLGEDAGNSTLSGASNTAIGSIALEFLTSGDENSAVGVASLNALTTGSQNSAIGYNSQGVLISGGMNTSLGVDTLNSLLTGNGNVALGFNSGSAYTAGESSNLLLSNTGVAAESNTTRIGTQGAGIGQQNRAFMAGVYQVAPAVAAQESVIIDSAGQLGTVDLKAGSAFGAVLSATATNVTGDGTNWTVIFDSVLWDINSDYDNTTGIFTAPQDGLYQFTTTVTWANLIIAMNVGLTSINVAGTGPAIGTWAQERCNPFEDKDGLNGWSRNNGTIMVILDAGDEVRVPTQIDGGTLTASVLGGAGSPLPTYFQGALIRAL